MTIKDSVPAIRPSLFLDFAKSKYLDPRITFTRASTATYYDDETVAQAEQNLLRYSQDFNNATGWGIARGTVTADSTTAPDGTSTADTVTQTAGEITSASLFSASTPVIVAQHTYSIFAKPNGKNFIVLREDLQTGSVLNTWFNVSTGVVGTTGSGHTATITSAGNGWYRCAITFTTNLIRNGLVYAACADTNATFTVVDSGGIFIWGAQLEQYSIATPYLATTTLPKTTYLSPLISAASDVPRFDYNPITGESLGLLIEEARTNLAIYSEDFSNAAWTKTRTTASSNVIVAPDGTLTGDKLIEDTSVTTDHFITSVRTGVTSATYTASVYVRAAERSRIRLQIISSGAGSNRASAWFDASTGTHVSSLAEGDGSVTAVQATSVGNGWYRFALTGIPSAAGSGTAPELNITLTSSGTNTVYTGTGYSGLYIWGAQLEVGPSVSSYIKTVAATVTRVADTASIGNVTSFTNYSEGTLMFETSGASTTINYPAIGFMSATFSALRALQIFKAPNNLNWSYLVRTSTGDDVGLFSATGGAAVKAAFAYKVNDFAYVVNGTVVGTDTVGTIPEPVSIPTLGIGCNDAAGRINTSIKKLIYYPIRLTNAQMQKITS